jgi:hypothetical protein
MTAFADYVTEYWVEGNNRQQWNHFDNKGLDCMVIGFTTTYMQSMPITTDVVSSNLDQGEVYNIM